MFRVKWTGGGLACPRFRPSRRAKKKKEEGPSQPLPEKRERKRGRKNNAFEDWADKKIGRPGHLGGRKGRRLNAAGHIVTKRRGRRGETALPSDAGPRPLPSTIKMETYFC